MKNRYKSKNQTERRPIAVKMRYRLREGLFLICVATALFLFISLISYHGKDPGWSSSGLSKEVSNWGGKIGAFIADISLSLFGIIAYLFPLLVVLISWNNLNHQEDREPQKREWIFHLLGWLVLIASACGLANFYFAGFLSLPADNGGIVV